MPPRAASEEPTHAPDPGADEVYVAGPDGEALKCNGKLVKVKRSALGGRTPPLTPAQAAQRSVLLEPRAKVARCEKGATGKETGRAVFVDEGAAGVRSRSDREVGAGFRRPPLVTLSG